MFNARFALVSILALSAIATGCGPGEDPNGFTGDDALGDYAVKAVDQITLTSNYSVVVGTTGKKSTSAKVPYSTISGSPSAPVYTTFELSYDAPNHKFV